VFREQHVKLTHPRARSACFSHPSPNPKIRLHFRNAPVALSAFLLTISLLLSLSMTSMQTLAPPQDVNLTVLTCSAVFFSVSSISMLLINKCAFTGSPFNAGIIFMQNLFTTLLALCLCRCSPSFRFEPSVRKFRIWLPCVALFVGTIMFSACALSLINIPTFSVFRNSSSLLVAALEYFLLGKGISRIQGVFLVLLLVASLIYGWNDILFSFSGYCFAILHVVCIALYSVTVKRLNVEFSSSLEMSIYNNAGSLPILFVIAVCQYHSSSSAILIQSQACTVASIPVAFLISWSGLISQRMFSATSWMTLNNFNKLPMLLSSYILFKDSYSLGQSVGLVVSVAASAGYSYCSLPNGASFASFCESLRSYACSGFYSMIQKRQFYVFLLTMVCFGGLLTSSNHLQSFYFVHAPDESQPDHSLSSCFQLASACYGNWSQDAVLTAIDPNFTNVVWFFESETALLSPLRSSGQAAIQKVLLDLEQVLSEKPSRHIFISSLGSSIAAEILYLSALFTNNGILDFEISSLLTTQRVALAHMLIADIVVGPVGSLVDIVSQFSATPFVIQVLFQHDDSLMEFLLDEDAIISPNHNVSLTYFLDSWIDAAAVPDVKYAISEKLKKKYSAMSRANFAFTPRPNCDEKIILEKCRLHFSSSRHKKSCFWGIRTRGADASIQLTELFAFIKASLHDSLEFVYEPFFLQSSASEYSWFDHFFGISRLMSALEITAARVDGQPLSTGYRCESLIRLPYHESVLLLERNPKIYAEHLCPNCIFKGTDSATSTSLHRDISISTNFQGLHRRGSLPTRINALTCDGFNSQRSKFFRGWPQTIMSKVVTSSESECYNKRSFRRCHDVHSQTDGISLRACQWRLPNGPCEDIARNHRDQLIAVTKRNAFLDTFPLVQLAWRTKIFGAAPPSSGPTVCTRADEKIACAVVDGSSVPSFWDKVRGSAVSVIAHGSLWHPRDIPGQKYFW
jgi:GDP-mannose transporter